MQHPQLTGEARVALLRAKIQRAKKHLYDLEIELVKYEGRKKRVGLADFDPKTGEMVGNPSTIELSVISFDALTIAGDVIHNLRSALDHLAHHLVLVGSPGVIPTRQIEFPIAQDFATYEAIKTRKVKGMRLAAIKAIDALKPYKGGNDALWRIHELDIIDKHRTIFEPGEDWLLEAPWVRGN